MTNGNIIVGTGGIQRRFPLPLTGIIHENLSILMCFIYSHQPLAAMMDARFEGEWKYLNKVLFEISHERAVKACLEIALFFRILDEEENITEYLEQRLGEDCGVLVITGKPNKRLNCRDASNKIIHAGNYEFVFPNGPMTPAMLICHTKEPKKWERAEIDLLRISLVCGQLMS